MRINVTASDSAGVGRLAVRSGKPEDLPLRYCFKDQGSRVQSLNPYGFKDFFICAVIDGSK
jgi:hypothetical protein